MSIHYLEDSWPEPVEEPTRWSYSIGSRVLFVKEIAEAFTVQVRTA